MNEDIYNKFMLFLGMFCIVLGISVLLSQIGLRIDATRNMLTSADILDGAIAVWGHDILNPKNWKEQIG